MHEITHSADWGNLISNSAEWVKYSRSLKIGNPPQYPVDLNELLALSMEFYEEKNKFYSSVEFEKQFLPKLISGPQDYDDFNRLSMKSSLAFKQRKFMLSNLAEEAEALFPTTPKPHELKAICLGMIGKASESLDETLLAIKYFDSANVPPYSDDYLDMLYVQAANLADLDKFDEAEKVIGKVISSPNKYALNRAKRLKQRIQEARKQKQTQANTNPASKQPK